jgi:hypothetical protein
MQFEGTEEVVAPAPEVSVVEAPSESEAVTPEVVSEEEVVPTPDAVSEEEEVVFK